MRVLVGLSGGVDSAIAAYLLKQQGYDVTCAFMRNWDSTTNQDFLGNPTIDDDICPQEKDYNDAKAVAEALGLELLRVDFIKEYWDYVFTSFLEDIKRVEHRIQIFYVTNILNSLVSLILRSLKDLIWWLQGIMRK